MKILKTPGFEKFQSGTTRFITRHWFTLHVLFLVFYIGYFLLKTYKIRIFGTADTYALPSFDFPLFLANLAGFVILAVVLVYLKGLKLWQYAGLIFLGISLVAISYVKTTDPGLEWPGSDVAVGNIISAEETVKYGTFDLIKTWNERVNPYEYTAHFTEVKDSTIKFLNKYNLNFLVFDKWKYRLDSAKYNISLNDRPYVHSPFTTLTMGWWLNVFPFGRWSLEYEMLFINLMTVLVVILFARKKVTENFMSIVLISIASSPVMFRFHSPSIDQISTLLFTLPVFLFVLYPSKKFTVSFFYGLIYGFCFYSKFTVLFFLAMMIVSFAAYYKRLTLKPLLGMIAGMLVPVVLFTALGYYFWITMIMGRIITQQIANTMSLNLFESLTKFLYFGPSFLLLTLLLIVNFNRVKKEVFPIYVPLLLSLIFMIFFLYDQGGWNRYLGQYMPVILLLVCSTDKVIELRKKDLLISVIANFIFLQLNMYF